MRSHDGPARMARDKGVVALQKFATSNTAVFPYFQAIGALIALAAMFTVRDWRWWAFSLAMYFITCCVGLSVTYHRFLTHRSFELAKWQEYLFSWFGAMGATGSTLGWVAMHHHHHKNADKIGDPHSPRLRGLRILGARLEFDFNKWSVRRLACDPFHRALHQYYHLLLLAWGGLLALIDPLAMLHGFLIPAAMQLNVSSLSNYCNHGRGYRNYNTDDDSTNNAMIALLAWGEGWHNNHHHAPRSWTLRTKWWEIDPTAWVIRLVRQRPRPA